MLIHNGNTYLYVRIHLDIESDSLHSKTLQSPRTSERTLATDNMSKAHTSCLHIYVSKPDFN
jgi:hypothetical protein